MAYQPDTGKRFYNDDAEINVIGGFLLDDRALKHVYALNESDFYGARPRNAFAAILSLLREKTKIDPLTVEKRQSELGTADAETAGYLIGCMGMVISAAMTEQYTRIVKECSDCRKVRDTLERGLLEIRDPMNDCADVAERARTGLRNTAASNHTWVETSQMLVDTYIHLERVSKGEIKPIRSHVGNLDQLISGFYPGELTIVGGRPGTGKSAFALNIAMAAAKEKKHVCFCSIEMSEIQLGLRVFSMISGINGMMLRNGEIGTDEWKRLAESMAINGDLTKSYLYDVNTLEDLMIEIQRRADDGKLDMLIVDYLQLMRSKRKFSGERERVNHISAAMKQITKDYNIPVIALSQLRRPEGKGDYPPGMTDLKESGNIEQDADNIILMHRSDSPSDKGVNKEDAPRFAQLVGNSRHYISFHVVKQRQGEIGHTQTLFTPSVMKYQVIERMGRYRGGIA